MFALPWPTWIGEKIIMEYFVKILVIPWILQGNIVTVGRFTVVMGWKQVVMPTQCWMGVPMVSETTKSKIKSPMNEVIFITNKIIHNELIIYVYC